MRPCARCKHSYHAHSTAYECDLTSCDCAGYLDQRDDVIDLAGLGPDEREIMNLLHDRLRGGRQTYGEWRVDRDTRDFRVELLNELLDGLMYGTAEVVRLRRAAP